MWTTQSCIISIIIIPSLYEAAQYFVMQSTLDQSGFHVGGATILKTSYVKNFT